MKLEIDDNTPVNEIFIFTGNSLEPFECNKPKLTEPMWKITRDGSFIDCKVNIDGVEASQAFGVNLFLVVISDLAPIWYETKIIPKLYKKAQDWAMKVLINHSTIKQ